MQTFVQELTHLFKNALTEAFPLAEAPELEVVQSSNEKFGHYQFNSAMKLAKGLQKNPRQIAEEIVKHFHKGDLVADLSIAGPGFINITLQPKAIQSRVAAMLKSAHLAIDPVGQGQRVIIDFSSPNIAKEMHVGHLRSTIIGDSLANLFEFLGYDVLRQNHVGDWGTAFGMLIAYMKDQAPQVLQGTEQTDLTHLVAWYKAAKKRFDENPDFKKSSQLEVVSLQSGEKEALHAWEIICDISRKAYQEIYDLLGVKIFERGESYYNPMLADVVADLDSKGLITVSNGAKCLFLEGFVNREGDPLPLMVQKSDGGYNYDTTDMAAIKHRIEVEKGTRLIYVTDAGQASHFAMIFKAAEMAGYLDPKVVQVDHVPFGLVLGADGKKFRTRAGDTERLIDLLNTATESAEKILDERSPDMDKEEKSLLAKALGIGAVKYADLSCHRTSDYTFSYERMLKFEGNTAAYLMYSYVRVAGIKRKVQANLDAVMLNSHIHLEHPSEIALGLHLAQFPETLEMVSKELLPNRLTDYLYGLAEKFNAFFRDCRVEGSPQQNERLLLSEITARVLKKGLEILGVHPVEKM